MNKRCLLCCVVLLMLAGCGLTVTNEPLSYEELDQPERDAVDIVYDELQALDTQVRQRSQVLFSRGYSLSPLVDKDRIIVDFEGLLFSFNFGDGRLRVSTWENLTSAQRAVVGSWFNTTGSATETTYKTFVYRFMALSQGMKQFMYNLHTIDNVYQHKYIFSMEFDSTRATHAYLKLAGRQAKMWTAVTRACTPILNRSELKNAYSKYFTAAESAARPMRFPRAKAYLQDNWRKLADPDDPTGYMYFYCKAAIMGQQEARGFDSELQKIQWELDW